MGKATTTAYCLAMNRKEYLNLCKGISELPDGSGGVKRNIPHELLVTYDSVVYYPLYFEIHFKRGEFYDVAALHSLKANSLMHVPLEDVKPFSS